MTPKQQISSLTSMRRMAMIGLATTALSLLVACTASRSTFDPLLNQGVMPVSSDNPFMGANLFLAREMEQSVYLYNFMKEKGSPQAIELKGQTSRDIEAHLFYSGSLEEYVAKPAPKRARSTEAQREWIIIGPFSVGRDRYRDVQQLDSASGGVFEIFGRRELLGGLTKHESKEELHPVFIPTPAPAKKAIRKRVRSIGGASANGPAVEISEPLNFDQQALKEARENSPRDSHGDIVHTVRSKTETLQSISKWYTSSDTNTKEIAEKNKLPLDAKLNTGASVIVPGALVVNPKRMK